MMRSEYTEFGASQRMPRHFAENKAPERPEIRAFPHPGGIGLGFGEPEMP
jgi:hypothetical protein